MTNDPMTFARPVGTRPATEPAGEARQADESRLTRPSAQDAVRGTERGRPATPGPRFEESISQAMRQGQPAAASGKVQSGKTTEGSDDSTSSTDEPPSNAPTQAPPEAMLAMVGAATAVVPAPALATPADDAAADGTGGVSLAADVLATLDVEAAGRAIDPRALPGEKSKPTDVAGNVAESEAASIAIDDPAASESEAPLPGFEDDASPAASRRDALLARSPADFGAQLAQARGAPPAHAVLASVADAAASSSSSTAPLHRVDLQAPLGDPAFPGRFAAQVALIGASGIERAEIQLQPRELGPVRIELSLSGESARIAFSAAQPETRQAIEQSLPILKDLLAERGLMLGQASVSDGRSGSGSGEPAAPPSTGIAHDGTHDAHPERSLAADARRTALRRTLLDVYA